jgi:hypothetical protein
MGGRGRGRAGKEQPEDQARKQRMPSAFRLLQIEAAEQRRDSGTSLKLLLVAAKRSRERAIRERKEKSGGSKRE